MNGVVNLGPLALATDRLLAVALLIGFLFAMDRILAREGKNAVPATGLAIVGGLIAARIAYIFHHRDAIAYDWWSPFAVWQGGFSAWAGLAVAAGERQRTSLKSSHTCTKCIPPRIRRKNKQ